MKTKIYYRKFLGSIFIMALILSCGKSLEAQEVTTYQYRQVANDKIDEFIKRETTYWSKVAKKAIDKGTLLFWGLFEKVGGTDLENSSNYLFVNTYKNVDSNPGEIWNPAPLFPGVPISKIETNSISKTTANIFLKDDGWEQASNAVPAKDFQYVVMNYHNSTNPTQFVAIEKNQWGPFIKLAMDKNETDQRGWGNSIVLAPTGGSMKFNCLSFDLFANLKGALMQTWSADTKFPTAGLDSLQKIIVGEPERVIYRVVKVESKD